MNDFPYIPVSPESITKRKLVRGVGINDAFYNPRPYVQGIRKHCPYYMAWVTMFTRCYSQEFQSKYTAYQGCSVHSDWHLFSTFKTWMETQDWKGKALDKDILVPNNKVYSEDTCVFVDQAINNLLTDHRAARGELPQGVTRKDTKSKPMFQAELSKWGKSKYLGTFPTPELAHEVYRKAKATHIKLIALTQSTRVMTALNTYADNLLKTTC